MKKLTVCIVVFVSACVGVDNLPADSQTCDREVQCEVYPNWQTWSDYSEGYSNLECEPCWWNHQWSQINDCCSCDPNEDDWCSADGEGLYHCTPLGEFEYESCRSWCYRGYNLPYGGECVDGECGCLS